MLTDEDREYFNSVEFLKEFERDQRELLCSGSAYEPIRKATDPDDIKAGCGVLPDGALYAGLEILREMGCPNPKIVWVKRYPDKTLTMSFSGVCPIHRYEHRNNRFAFLHKEASPERSWLICYHDRQKREIPLLPFSGHVKDESYAQRWEYR